MKKIIVNTNALTNARIKAGYSIRQIAKRSLLSSGTYHQVECGHRPARPDTAAKICEVLEKPFDDLFTIEEVSNDT